MAMSDPEYPEFVRTLGAVAEAYGVGLSSERIKIYWSKLRPDVSLADLKVYVDRHLKTSPRFPQVAEIVSGCRKPRDTRHHDPEQLDSLVPTPFDNAVTRAVAIRLAGSQIEAIVGRMDPAPELSELDIGQIIAAAEAEVGPEPPLPTGPAALRVRSQHHRQIIDAARRIAHAKRAALGATA